ncbi:hypothetical protein QTP70_014842, partial [Hemibagrus guttatus]
MIPTGCKDPELRHIYSYKRQAFMILNKRDEDLNVIFKTKSDGEEYTIYATSGRITHRQRIRKRTNSKGQPQKVMKGGKTLRQRQWWDHDMVLIQQLCREYTVNITRDITKSLEDLEIGIVELQALAESTGDRILFWTGKKKNCQSRLIHTLHTGNGQYITHTDEIQRYTTDFYQDLNRSEQRDSKELPDTFYQGLPKASSEDNAALEGPLVLEELHAVLNTMPGGKAPGIDGLPVEFYKFFWKELGKDLLEVLEESCRESCLPLSSRRAVITLLPKKKGTSRTLRTGVQCHCYVQTIRSIIDNVSLIRDILDVSRSLAVDLGLISLDQGKAFDRVEHQYLWKTLEAFGLSPSLIAMMKCLPLNATGKKSKAIALGNWSHGLPQLPEEPLVGGGRMDIKDSSPGLAHITQSEKFTTLKRLVDTAGPEFEDTRAMAEELGLRSLRYTEDIIQRWTNKLPEDELNLIKEYHDGAETPDRGDPFPELELLPDLNGHEGMYLDAEKGCVLPIYEAKGKDIYKCVKVINKRKLDRRVDTVWRQGLGVLDDIKPVWRVFYKTPVRKRAGVLQWRILHGAV